MKCNKQFHHSVKKRLTTVGSANTGSKENTEPYLLLFQTFVWY